MACSDSFMQDWVRKISRHHYNGLFNLVESTMLSGGNTKHAEVGQD